MTPFDTPRAASKDPDQGSRIAARCQGPPAHEQIKLEADCDIVLLVLLDIATLDPMEMWEASYLDVCTLLSRPGSKSRERGALGVTEYKRWQHPSGERRIGKQSEIFRPWNLK